MDYIIQKSAWNSSGSTSQRIKQLQATFWYFSEMRAMSIYIVTEFHASDELFRGPEI